MFYKGKSVLVTGGSGFVGSHIVRELLKQGANVRVSLHKRPLAIKHKNIETISADLTKQKDCLRAVKNVQYVFHAAGCVGSAAAGTPMSGITKNLIITSQMLQAAWELGVDRFLLFSSSTVYPAVNHPVKEEEMGSAPMHPSYFGYGWMRRYFEVLGEYVSSQSKLKVAIVRPTAVYGKRDNFDLKVGHVIPALIRKAVDRQDPYIVWGTGNEIRDFLSVEDLARACLLIVERHANCDPVNIGSGRAMSIKEIVKVILRAANYTDANVVFDSSKPTTIPYRMVDISKAKKILDFEPKITIEEGIRDTVKWYMQNKNKLTGGAR